MIGSLRGTVIEVSPTGLLLEIQGIGYSIITTRSVLSKTTSGEQMFVYIHDHVREDAHDLYGFVTHGELTFFEQLIGISGVGPKLAMTMLSGGTVDDLRAAIMAGDLSRLTNVPGIGKKTAQKIVLELKGQLVDEEQATPQDRDALEALVSLGYSATQARDALKSVAPSVMDVSVRIREALKYLGT